MRYEGTVGGEGWFKAVTPSLFLSVAEGSLLIIVLMDDISKFFGNNYVSDLVIYFVPTGVTLCYLQF